MSIDFAEWITLNEAFLRATAALGNSKIAKLAIRNHLELREIAAICSLLIVSSLQNGRQETRWPSIPPAFWPGSAISWVRDIAYLSMDRQQAHQDLDPTATYEAQGILVRQHDIASHWPTGEDLLARARAAKRATIVRQSGQIDLGPSSNLQKVSTTKATEMKWSATKKRLFQNKTEEIADGHRTFREVFDLFNTAIAPDHVGENKFRKELWNRIPDEKKRGDGDNARTLAAKKS